MPVVRLTASPLAVELDSQQLSCRSLPGHVEDLKRRYPTGMFEETPARGRTRLSRGLPLARAASSSQVSKASNSEVAPA